MDEPKPRWPLASPAWLTALLRSRWARRLFSAAVFAGALYLIYRQVSTISLSQFLAALASTAPLAVVLSVALTVASYLCLAGTEWLALGALGHRFSYVSAARVAIPCYALTNSAGFSPATGTVLRIRLYGGKGVSAAQSVKVSFLAGAAVTVSGLVSAGLAIAVHPHFISQALHIPQIVAIGVGLLLLAPASLWFIAFRRRSGWPGGSLVGQLPGRARALGLACGVGDWIFSCAALFALLPHPDWRLFPNFFVAYIGGSLISAATGVPGGLGVFEAVVLLLTSIVAQAHETAAALLLYRCIYSLGPLALLAAAGVFRRTAR